MEQLSSQEQQFVTFLEGHIKLIAKVARAYCRDEEERKDLIQDIITQLWQSYPKYDNTHALSTWTYRIALNVSISNLRKKTSRHRTYKGYQQELDSLPIDETKVDEKLAKLYQFIEQLKPLDKAIIVLQLEGLGNNDISQIMGMSVSNISTRKNRIKDELKYYFETSNQRKNEI